VKFFVFDGIGIKRVRCKFCNRQFIKKILMIIVVYLVGQWETFHRRPMLEALARQALGRAVVLCINPVISSRGAIARLARRSMQKLLLFGRVKRLTANLYVGTPVVWHAEKKQRWQIKDSNGWKMISRQIQNIIDKIAQNSKSVVSWIYRPEQAFCLGLAKEKFVVYECYDEYSLSHIDGTVIPGAEEKEVRLIKKVDLIFTTGHSLFESRKGKHPNVHYAPNGVDFALFNEINSNKLGIASDLKKMPSPRIGYIGNLSGRIDFRLLEKIAKYNAGWSLILVGPFEEEVKDSMITLMRQPNVHYLGYKPYREIPQYLKGFDVCILPFKKHAWNEYSNPLKLWEYLAAGKPVVSILTKEMRALKEVIWLAEDHNRFIFAIRKAMDRVNERRIASRIEISRQHSWDNLTRKMFETVNKHISTTKN
jgi:glycosyltransferase involved in cell wall biosynthesis